MGFWAQDEYFALLPIVAALLTFTLGAYTQHIRYYLAAGLLSGLGITTSQFTGLHFLVLLLFSINQPSNYSPSRVRRYYSTAALLSGAMLVFSLIGLIYLCAGSSNELLYGALEFPLLYAGAATSETGVYLAVERVLSFALVAAPWILMSAVGLVLLLRQRPGRHSLLLAWVLVSAAVIMITRRFHFEYFAMLLPGMALLIGYATDNFSLFHYRARTKRMHRMCFYLAFTLALFSAVYFNSPIYKHADSAERHVLKVSSASRLREAQSPSVAAYIAERTGPDDLIYNLGRQGELYFYAGRRPASRYFHEFPLASDPRAIRVLLQDLERNKPAYIIDSQWPTYLEGGTAIYPWEILTFLQTYYLPERRIAFDPGLQGIYREAFGAAYVKEATTYYADVWRLKDEYSGRR